MQSLAFIQWCLAHLNYWVILFLMTLESTVIPVPSELVVPPAAWLSATEGDLNIFLVIVFATIGADLGASINYVLALWLGRPIVYAFARSKFGHLCLVNEEKIKRAETYFDDHGATGTFIGRLIPGIRHLISIPAGLARMNYWRFILYTTLGAGIWNCVLAAIGYSLKTVCSSQEELVEMAMKYSHELGYAIAAIVGVALLVLIFKKYKKKNQR